MLVRPSRAALARASASNGAAMSHPSTLPVGPTALAFPGRSTPIKVR